MSREFLVPIVLPADPVVPMEAATKQYVDSKTGPQVAAGERAGTVKWTAEATAPTGWAFLQGQTLVNAQTVYPDLWNNCSGLRSGANVILPDARGRTLIGAGTGSGLTARTLYGTSGFETHTLTTAEMPVHSHGVTDPGHSHTDLGHSHGAKSGTVQYVMIGSAAPNFQGFIAGSAMRIQGENDTGSGEAFISNDLTGITTTTNAGSGGAHNNMQPWLALNPMIALVNGAVAAGAGGISIEEEGTVVHATTTAINFVGAGVTATYAGSGEVTVTIAAGGSSTYIGDTAPPTPNAGDMWYESDSGRLFIYYDSFWVEVAHPTVAGGGSLICTSSTRPSAPFAGMRIYESDTKRELLYDGTGWIIMREPPQTLTTCQLRQNSVVVAATIGQATFQRADGWCDMMVGLAATGAGTAGQPIDVVIGGHPNALNLSPACLGTFTYYDAGNQTYVGACAISWSQNKVDFTTHGTNWTLGGNPNFAIANTDGMNFALRYRMSNLYG